MTRYFFTIGGRRVAEIDGDVQRVRQDVTDAIRSGGGYVPLPSPDGVFHVLVSPGFHTSIETVQDAPEEPEPDSTVAGAATVEAVYPATDDFDEWGI